MVMYYSNMLWAALTVRTMITGFLYSPGHMQFDNQWCCNIVSHTTRSPFQLWHHQRLPMCLSLTKQNLSYNTGMATYNFTNKYFSTPLITHSFSATPLPLHSLHLTAPSLPHAFAKNAVCYSIAFKTIDYCILSVKFGIIGIPAASVCGSLNS